VLWGTPSVERSGPGKFPTLMELWDAFNVDYPVPFNITSWKSHHMILEIN